MTQTDPVEAEAAGQRHIVATYRGHDYKLPLDVDEWPLALVGVSVGISAANKLITDRGVVAQALSRILGDQWRDFLKAFPRSRDLVRSSQEFAAAVGFAGESQDRAFGALPRLLATLQTWCGAVEATLGEMGLDYRDRWRFDAEGRRLLTLRQIHVRLKYARPNCALAIAQNNGKMPFSANDLLLMDLFEVLAHRAHPSRPLTPEQVATRKEPKKKSKDELIADYHRRHASKTTAIATAQANARKAAHAPSQEAQAPSS